MTTKSRADDEVDPLANPESWLREYFEQADNPDKQVAELSTNRQSPGHNPGSYRRTWPARYIKQADRVPTPFAARLREALAAKVGADGRSWTQGNLAAASGAHQSDISQYLNGLVEPRTGRLVALAKALGVTCDWLLGCV
jgi:Helix-turn-helix